MSDRVSQTVLLCEDNAHERLVKSYMGEANLLTKAPYVRSIVDADDHSVDERRRQLLARLTAAEYDPPRKDEPVAILIPKRNVETWIAALLGQTVNEDDDYKGRKPPSKDEIRQAARVLFEWSRPNAAPGATCVPSLQMSLSDWQKIR